MPPVSYKYGSAFDLLYSWKVSGTHCGNMINVWLRDHGAHCVFHTSVGKLIESVLVPYFLQIEVGATHEGLQKG